MKKILVAGATGQLGTKVCQKLAVTGQYALRIFVRRDSRYEHLMPLLPEIVTGDLTDKKSIEQAVEGSDIIITTANTAAPRKKADTFASVDVQGHKDLIDAAKKFNVRQFIYTSAVPLKDPYARWVPLAASKRSTEAYLKKSGLNYTIFQPCAFMDVYFAFMGTDQLAVNEPAALVNRPWGFLQTFYSSVKNDVKKGKIGIIGSGRNKQSYITIDNVADFLTKAVGREDLFQQTIVLGGPEALSALEVKAIFEKVFNKELAVKKTPAAMMKIMGNVFSLFNQPASNILKLNYVNAVTDTVVESHDIARRLSVQLTTAEEYLKSKVTT